MFLVVCMIMMAVMAVLVMMLVLVVRFGLRPMFWTFFKRI
jgi:hypothetical protein